MAGSKKAIYAALFGNLGIAISKLIAFLFSGSPSMLSETLHSFSDTANQILLLIGSKTSLKKPDERHQFGYGKDQFFWSFVVSTMLFGISGGLAFQHGFQTLFDTKHIIENSFINYITLFIAFLFEANAFRVAYKSFRESIIKKGNKITIKSLISEYKDSRDVSIITVITEDASAMLGIIIAAVGVYLSDFTQDMRYDSIGSILIGIVLMAFAFFLAKENRGLLIGESMSIKERKKLIMALEKLSEVKKVMSIKTMFLSANDVIIALEVILIDDLETTEIGQITDKIEREIMKIIPYVNKSKIYVEVKNT